MKKVTVTEIGFSTPGLLRCARNDDSARTHNALDSNNTDSLTLNSINADILRGDLERTTLFRDLGLLVMQLSYNTETPFGSGLLAEEVGLKALGADAVARMNELGVLVDLSHSNTPTTLEAAGISTKPVAATHAGARAVHGNIRNNSDAELLAIAETGGVVGVYLMWFRARF